MQGLLILEMDRCISVWVLYNHNLNEYRLYVMLLYFLQAFLVYYISREICYTAKGYIM